MDMSPQEYQAYIKQKSPRSPIVKDTALAFLIGGAICVLGQLILDGYRSLGLDKTDAGTATSVTLIFLAALTTGLNLYNSLARFAGAGTLVPITGFANSVVSPAIDFKAEDRPIIDIQSVLWSEYADLVQNQSFLPTYHLHAFTLNGGCVLFLFSMHFHNTSSAYFSRWGNFSFLKGGQKGCHFYIHYERCIRGVL